MRLVIQRVERAEVRVEERDELTGKIGPGLFILVGIKKGDSEDMAVKLAQKVLKMRVMADAEQKMNLSAKEFLVVSQFTLYADTSGGNRPSFVSAEEPSKAKVIYETFVSCLQKADVKVATGSFGEYMKISAELAGPVTILVEN